MTFHGKLDADTKPMAGREAEWGERIPDKAAIWDALQVELALHERTKQRLAEAEFERDELRAWKAEALAFPPAGRTEVEKTVHQATITDWSTK